tara:strand:- start:328 stop:1494 length:1167 start_codon:yes stop_codon:yes gene_type:complete
MAKKKKKGFFNKIKSSIMGGKNTGNKDAQTKKSWADAEKNIGDHKHKAQYDRLTAKYGDKFQDTVQGKYLSGLLDDISVNKGGNRGEDDKSFYNTGIGNEAADAYRKSLTNRPLGPGYNREELISGIKPLARQGLEDSDKYFKFNQTLREQDPGAYDNARGWSSGKNVGNLMNLLPGVGTIGRGLKSIYDAGKDKFSEAGKGIFAEADEDIVTNTPDNINSGDYLAEKYGKQDEDLVTNILDLKKNRVDQKTKENGIMDVAELTDDQKRFIDLPRNSLDFQSLDSLYKKIMTPQGGFDDGFWGTGFGGQEDTTKEELKDYLGIELVADGGYMSSFPHQNIGTQSLTASDNIDDRIMKNLEFEKMAPGMMGYNTGGLVEPMEPDYSRGI